MAELQTILSGGALTGIQLNGTGVPEKVLSSGEIDAKLSAYVPISGTEEMRLLDPAVMPIWAKGKLFYDAAHDCPAYYTGNSAVTIQIGQELTWRIHNSTGATIPNGTPVRDAGGANLAHAVRVAPALADSFANAKVIVVTTHDILDGTTGLGTSAGEVHGVDTSAWADGADLYLSDTTAGGLTTVPPGITSLVGYVVYSHATDGIIRVNPRSNLVLPATIGILDGKVDTMSLTLTYQDVAAYTSSDSLVTAVDAVAGTVTPTATGKYRTTINLTVTVPSASQTRTLTIQIWDSTAATQKALSVITIAKDATQVSRSFAKILDLTNGSALKLRLISSVNISGVSFDDVSFDVVSIKA